MRTRNGWLLVLMVAVASACDPDDGGDDGLADDGEEQTGDAGEGDDGPATLSFDGSVAPIFSANCSCHIAGSGGLTFGADPYGAIVGVTATGSDLSYVEPGDVSASYLVHKVRGSQATVGGAGATMPLGGMLTEEQIVTIEQWIEAGAPE